MVGLIVLGATAILWLTAWTYYLHRKMDALLKVIVVHGDWIAHLQDCLDEPDPDPGDDKEPEVHKNIVILSSKRVA